MTTYTFDAAARQVALTDGLGNVTTWTHDALGQVTAETNELGDSITSVYDDAGRVTVRTDRRGHRFKYTYDGADRVTGVRTERADGVVLEFLTHQYDADGRLAQRWLWDSTAGGMHERYTYDGAGRVTSQTRVSTGTLHRPAVADSVTTYRYAPDGTPTGTKITVGGQSIDTAYRYDDAGRLNRITRSVDNIVEADIAYVLNDAGEIVSYQRFAGTASAADVLTTYTRDLTGRRTGITHTAAGGGVLADHGYTFDPADRVTATTSTVDGPRNLTLDDNGRLTGAIATALPDETFAHDATGNRTGAGYQTGANNRLIADGAFTYTYDAAGNRTSRTSIADSSRTTYRWDHRNRLIGVVNFNTAGAVTGTADYSYDAADQLVTRRVTAGGTTTTERYVLADGNVVAVTDGSGTVTHRYVHGQGDDAVLAETVVAPPAGQPALRWTLADRAGSITDVAALTPTGIQSVNHVTFSSYGMVLAQTDAAYQSRFGFTGRPFDAVAGAYQVRARWMDPAAGRFLSEDSIGFAGGLANLSDYVGASPYDYTDPSGNSRLSSWWRRNVKPVVEVAGRAIGDVADMIWDGIKNGPDNNRNPDADTIGDSDPFNLNQSERFVLPAAPLPAPNLFQPGGFEAAAAGFDLNQHQVAVDRLFGGMGQNSSFPTAWTGIQTPPVNTWGVSGFGDLIGGSGLSQPSDRLSSRSVQNLASGGLWSSDFNAYSMALFDPIVSYDFGRGDLPGASGPGAGQLGEIPSNVSFDGLLRGQAVRPATRSVGFDPLLGTFTFDAGFRFDPVTTASAARYATDRQRLINNQPVAVSGRPSVGSGVSSVQSVPGGWLGQTSTIIGAGLGSVGGQIGGFFNGLIQAPGAILSGQAGRALGERAVAMATRFGDGQFDGGVNDYAVAIGSFASDSLGVTGMLEGYYGVDALSGDQLDWSQRGSRAAFGASSFATSTLGGVTTAAKLAPTTLGGLAKTGPLTAQVTAWANQPAEVATAGLGGFATVVRTGRNAPKGGMQRATYSNLYPDEAYTAVRRFELRQVDGRWKTFDTNGNAFTARGEYNYVVQGDKIFVSKVPSNPAIWQRIAGHIDVARGGNVSYAGEIRFGAGRGNRGQLQRWDNMSGHYRPNASDAGTISDLLPIQLFGGR